MQEPDKSLLPPSKSQLKRDMLALQKLGEVLVSLPVSQLASIPLETNLLDAINTARDMGNNEGRRRQLQYIGKLMRHLDPAPIQQAIDKIQLKNNVNKSRFHQIERWRDRLVSEGDGLLQEFIAQYTDADSQHLRQLVRNAQKEKKAEKNTGAETALFRYLREIIEA